MGLQSLFLDLCTSSGAIKRSTCDDYEIGGVPAPSAWNCTADAVCGKAAAGCLEGVVGAADGGSLRQADLAAAMAAASVSVQPWISGSFGLIRRLQDACGNYGHVDLMESILHGGRSVAVKQMPNKWVASGPQEFAEQNPDAAERPWIDLGFLWELNRLQFPYTTELLGIFRDEEKTYVVTSLATEGDLFAWRAQEPRPGPEREALMAPIMQQVFAAVQWLHDLGIAHRDLSLENILLTEDGSNNPTVKIIDFAMSTLERSCQGEARGKVVYRAPEMYESRAYDPFLCDIFSLGVVAFAVAARDYPWSSTKPGSCKSFIYVCDHGLQKFLQQRRMRNGNGECLGQVFSPSFIELLEGLLDFDPCRRLSLGEPRLAMTGRGAARKTIQDSRWLSEACHNADQSARVGDKMACETSTAAL